MFNMFDQNLMLQQMRSELTENGFAELKTPEEVEQALAEPAKTKLLMINSVCGCAAGSARPGVVLSLARDKKPETLLTVFAGQDREATEQARKHLGGYPPTSPSAALFRDGEAVFMLHRHDIEGHTPEQIAAKLQAAYDQHCD